jgi:LPXTG-motif cell wall-anchored protein
MRTATARAAATQTAAAGDDTENVTDLPNTGSGPGGPSTGTGLALFGIVIAAGAALTLQRRRMQGR